ncbi:hypothetical protein FJZ39_04230 [Candidatus Saccharibacteria bacterium]|nr:hypothetical protein [Candidatus Saccharibacteria bacterium]
MNPDRQSNYWAPDESAEPELAVPAATLGVDGEKIETASNTDSNSQPALTNDDTPLTWEAPEFIFRPRSAMWYVWFTIALVVMLFVAIVLMRSITFSILLVVMAAAVIIYAKRPPAMITYSVSLKEGIFVGNKLYPFENFRSFGVQNDMGYYALVFIPTQRFHPSLTMYFPDAIGEELVDTVGVRLPLQDIHPDVIDRIIRKLHL